MCNCHFQYMVLQKIKQINIDNDWNNVSQVLSLSTLIVPVGKLNVAAIEKLA